MSLKEIRTMQSALAEKIKTEGKKLLGAEFKKFFKENSEILAVRWTQYTPHFNDGDPCTFDVHDFYYKTADLEENSGDYGDGFETAWGFKYHKKPFPAAAAGDFEAEVSDKDVMLGVFGDGVQVTATPKGFEVDEYSHD